MSRLRRFEIVEHSPSPFCFLNETSIFTPFFPIVEDDLYHSLDLLSFTPTPPLLFDDFGTVTDLFQIDQTPFHTSARRVTTTLRSREPYLRALSDRVSALELGFDRLVREEEAKKKKFGEKKYTWTAEIKSPENDRKYKWTAEIKDGKDEKKGLEKSYKWTAEIKRKGPENKPVEHKYTIQVSSGDSSNESTVKKKQGEKVKEKGKSAESIPRIVEIEEPSDHGGIVLRKVFAKSVDKRRGKRKELSLQDAATLIQMSFRAYLIQRSQALHALRELAIAKTKLKEIRAMFNNFSYRRRLTRDSEERQRFSEKIIVLLLTVDAIEGADQMVRFAKRSMVDELEAMLDVVDPQPPGKSLSTRRTFDMPDGAINKELAAGVAEVVRMLDQEASSSEVH